MRVIVEGSRYLLEHSHTLRLFSGCQKIASVERMPSKIGHGPG